MDQIQQVRSKIDIVELIGSYVSLKKAGGNFKGLCPFHSEKTPSFIVSPERQIFKCFGCQQGGDVFGFLMEYEKMSFAEALRFLAQKAGVKLTSFKPSTQQQAKDRLLEINHLAAEYYHYILLNHKVGKKGLNYLLGRGISPSLIKLFKLGYAPDTWDSLYNFLIRKKGYKQEEVEQTGLIIKSRGFYDRFRSRVVFPLKDHRGNVLGFSGRVIKQDEQGAKYINTPETSIYHKGELLYGLEQAKSFIKKEDRAVVVEGEFDVISSYQAGVKNIVGIKGSALTQEQVDLLKRFTQNLVLALDADMAGDSAVRRGIQIAEQADLLIRVVQPEQGKDPDECARQSAKGWREAVKKAVMVYDFYLNSAKKRFNHKTAEGKKRISEELTPIFNSITNQVVRAHYFKKLAQTLDVSEEILLNEAERLAKKAVRTSFAKKEVKKQDQPARQEILEELLLSLLLQSKNNLNVLLKTIDITSFNHPAVKKILEQLERFLTNNKLEINEFAAQLPPELVELLDKAYLRQLPEELKEEQMFLREFEKINKEIKRSFLQHKLQQLQAKIKQKEKEKQVKQLQSLRKNFVVLTQRLNQLQS